jgi:putative nucleotidyltransferase with HDIG domain
MTVDTQLRAETAPAEPGREMDSSGYVGIVLDRLARQAVEILAAGQSCIFVRDEADHRMAIIAAAHGPAEDSLGKRVHATAPHGIRASAAAVELCWEGDVHGSLTVRSLDGHREFSSEDLAALRTLGEVAGAAVAHSAGRHGAPGVRLSIRDLTATLSRRDGYTVQHSREVLDDASSIGRSLGLPPAAMPELEVAALLHDVGKVAVPDSILNKRGSLTTDERAVMMRHPTWGAETLARIPGLEAVATIVRYHHERWDGSGYPHGLAGARIPLASRIIAVCDAHNAMTTDRPYRDAMSNDRALSELNAGSGWQFDPAVVERFAVANSQLVAA